MVLSEKLFMKFLIALFSLCIFIACASNEIGNSKDVNPQSIFIDYSVIAEETDDSVTCLAQFRFAGENGTTLVLNDPSCIKIDEMNVSVDSNNVMGAFYKRKFATASFAGSHSWKYIDRESNQYLTGFVFSPFKLKNKLPASQSRGDSLLIKLDGLQNGAMVSVQLSDTSSKTEDVILKNNIKNGELLIAASTWQYLRPGPVCVGIYNTIDTSLPIDARPAEGGRLYVNYSLKKREINLKNDPLSYSSKF